MNNPEEDDDPPVEDWDETEDPPIEDWDETEDVFDPQLREDDDLQGNNWYNDWEDDF